MRVEGGGKSAVEKVQLGFFFFRSGSFVRRLIKIRSSSVSIVTAVEIICAAHLSFYCHKQNN